MAAAAFLHRVVSYSYRSDPLKMVTEGAIRVDSSDAENLVTGGKLETVLFHEMLHSMEFGSHWTRNGLVEIVGGSTHFVRENHRCLQHSYADKAITEHIGIWMP